MQLLKTLREFDRLPRGYGVAWLDTSSLTYVAAPWGLHLILGSVRATYQRLSLIFDAGPLVSAYNKGFTEGFQSGLRSHSRDIEILEAAAHRRGYQECIATMEGLLDQRVGNRQN